MLIREEVIKPDEYAQAKARRKLERVNYNPSSSRTILLFFRFV
jgi:hypothetical protein